MWNSVFLKEESLFEIGIRLEEKVETMVVVVSNVGIIRVGVQFSKCGDQLSFFSGGTHTLIKLVVDTNVN